MQLLPGAIAPLEPARADVPIKGFPPVKQARVIKGQEVSSLQGKAHEGAGGFRAAEEGAEGAIDPIRGF